MRKPPFQFGLLALIEATTAVALLLGFCSLLPEERSQALSFFLIALSVPLVLVLVLLPAFWFAKKMGQTLLGRLPPDELRDAKPIRFDMPREAEDE